MNMHMSSRAPRIVSRAINDDIEGQGGSEHDAIGDCRVARTVPAQQTSACGARATLTIKEAKSTAVHKLLDRPLRCTRAALRAADDRRQERDRTGYLMLRGSKEMCTAVCPSSASASSNLIRCKGEETSARTKVSSLYYDARQKSTQSSARRASVHPTLQTILMR